VKEIKTRELLKKMTKRVKTVLIKMTTTRARIFTRQFIQIGDDRNQDKGNTQEDDKRSETVLMKMRTTLNRKTRALLK